MNKIRKSLIHPRTVAFARQHGNCYYCGQPMWNKNPDLFSSKYKITKKQTKHFMCTGEHLVAHQDGGSSERHNIVAACIFCNLRRHRRKSIPNPTQYKKLVQQRINQCRWHNIKLLS